MSHGTEQHLEHAEHARHAAHDSFDRRVAMTMAIVAAVLACVTMLSHRAHNETLRLQGEANRLQTEANILHTQATDEWNFFQAKNIRNHQYQAYLELVPLLAKEAGTKTRQEKLRTDWAKKVEKYRKNDLPQMQEKARRLVDEATEHQRQGKDKLEESEHAHHRGDRFDLAELGVELALVLCSIAVLIKNSGFWYAGIGFGVLGLAVAVSAFLLP